MRLILFITLLLGSARCLPQVTESENQFLSQLKTGAPLPGKLLSARTAVFNTHTLTDQELEKIQQSFQRTGIDAVAYFETDYLFANRDVLVALADYLNQREITNLVFFQKTNEGFAMYIAEFNTKPTLIEQNQYAWGEKDRLLSELLLKLYRASANSLKKQNLLVIDVPETSIVINPILGRRSDFFAIDLKVDPIAIPKFGDAKLDKQLEELLTMYPYKYKLTEPGISEKDLRKQGFYYVLCSIHSRGKIAKELLGYDMTKAETALVSITYPNGQPVLKNFGADEIVYKFYIKHIDSQNVFLGTKWDADLTWLQALQNHLKAFKTELKIN